MAKAYVNGVGWIEKQTKTLDITNDGSYNITPDQGKMLSGVTVNVDTPGSKVATSFYADITENGEYGYVPGEGIVYNHIHLRVNVQPSLNVQSILNAYWNAEALYKDMMLTLGSAVLNDGYITITPQPNCPETFFILGIPYSTVTGEYCVIKYRLSSNDGYFEFFTSTDSASATAGHCMMTKRIGNGEWNILVFNAAQYKPTVFKADADGKYRAKYARFDIYSEGMSAVDVDVAYIGMCDSLEKALAFADTDRISYVEAAEQSRTIYTSYDKVANFYSTEGLEFVENSSCTECGAGEFAVSGYNGVDTDIVIPLVYITDTYDVYPVREIKADAFRAKYTAVVGVTIPSSVRRIGEYAFANTYISRLEINEGVREIGRGAFYNLWRLGSINIPGSVEVIDRQAFQYCSSCLSYDFTACTSVPRLMQTTAFDGMNANCKIYVPRFLYHEWIAATNWAAYADHIVGVRAEAEPSEGLELSLNCCWYADGYTVTGIGTCTDTVIVIPDHPSENDITPIVSIDDNAFQENTNITKVVFGRNIVHIGLMEFWGCSNCKVYDFSKVTAIPYLDVTSFGGSSEDDPFWVAYTFGNPEDLPEGTQFIVPASLYDAWIEETNWCVYADYIVAAE